MNAARLSLFHTALADAMTAIRTEDQGFYNWPPGATAESVASRLTEAVEKRDSIRGITLTDLTRQRVAQALGIKNTLISFDEYLKGCRA